MERSYLLSMSQGTRKARGFTLIELVISTALMSLILVSAYLCLNAGLAGKKLVEPRADAIQSARVAMTMLTQELRSACILPGDSPMLGMKRTIGTAEADNLDFATHYYTPRRVSEGDFCEVSYYVQPDPQTGHLGLWRRQNPRLAPDPLAGGEKREIIPDILGLQLEYSDGEDWYGTWGKVQGTAKADNSQKEQSNLDGLPTAVRITLLVDANPQSKVDAQSGERTPEPPLVFKTVAFLNLAETLQDDSGSTSGVSPGTSGGGNNGPTTGGAN
jgi:prepilin-type N-terminal cleavage/methylation domain-containing protein